MNAEVIKQVIVLFIILIVGIYARKMKYINKEITNGLCNLLLNITLPLLIIASFLVKYSKEKLINAAMVLLFSFVMHIILMIFSKFIYSKSPEKQKSVLNFMTVFSNSGFMGYPVLMCIYPKDGVFYGSVYNIAFNFFMFTYGVAVFSGEKDLKNLKKLILNPAIISIFIGFILFAFSIKLPDVVVSAINSVGNITSPLSMLIIGSMLAEVSIKGVFAGTSLYIGSFFRLIFAPLITFFILKTIGVNSIVLNVLVILEAMPSAANTAVMAEQYGGDSLFASRCIFVTTLLSIFTIPLITNILK